MYEKLEYYWFYSLRYDKVVHAENMIDEYEDKLSSAEKTGYEKIIEECEAELERYEDEIVYGKSGTKVWYGTVAAIGATK